MRPVAEGLPPITGWHGLVSRALIVSALIAGPVFDAAPARAGLLRLTSDTFFSRRTDDLQNPEAPMYEFLNASYVSEKSELQLNGNFSVFHDAIQGNSRFDLYTLDLSVEPVPGFMKIHGGRVFDFYRSARALSSDSLGVDFTLLDRRLNFGASYGIERSLALGNFNASASALGVYANYRTQQAFPWLLGSKFRSRTYADSTRPVENAVRLSAQKPLPGRLSPELLLDSELLADTGHLNSVEAGTNLYPGTDTAIRLRGMIYDVPATVGIEQPIYSIFSQGRLYEGLIGVDRSFSAAFGGSLAFGYDDYLLQGATRATGRRFELGLRWSGETLSLRNSAYVFDSPGGSVYGDHLSADRRLTDRIELNGAVEVTYYEKVTSSRRFATSSMLGATAELRKHLRLLISGELNNNNALQYDFRVNARLTYSLWGET